MKTTHSPLPWKIDHNMVGIGGVKVAGVEGVANCGIQGDANAALIVRAVNAHAELVAALEGITIAECPACSGTGKEDGRFDDDACPRCGGCGEILRGGWPADIRAAIAIAKGEA